MGFELVELALLHAVPYLGDELLGAEGEVGLHHPVVVGGLLLEDFDDGMYCLIRNDSPRTLF